MAATQRRFAVMGDNLFKIINKLVSNQRLCRLLKYQNSTPFSDELSDIDGIELVNKQIVIVPKIPENLDIECSYITVIFDKYIVNPNNDDFKICTIRFDIACPYEEWMLDESNLRPYLIMQEVDEMFNQQRVSGIGKLQFSHSEPLTLSPQFGGYSMFYTVNEFN